MMWLVCLVSGDKSRVKLLPTDDEEGSDYINASYLPVRLTVCHNDDTHSYLSVRLIVCHDDDTYLILDKTNSVPY